MANMPVTLRSETYVNNQGKWSYKVTHKTWASWKCRNVFFSSEKIALAKAVAFCHQYGGVAIAINDPKHSMYKHNVFGVTGPFAGLFATQVKVESLEVKIDLSKI